MGHWGLELGLDHVGLRLKVWWVRGLGRLDEVSVVDGDGVFKPEIRRDFGAGKVLGEGTVVFPDGGKGRAREPVRGGRSVVVMVAHCHG